MNDKIMVYLAYANRTNCCGPVGAFLRDFGQLIIQKKKIRIENYTTVEKFFSDLCVNILEKLFRGVICLAENFSDGQKEKKSRFVVF